MSDSPRSDYAEIVSLGGQVQAAFDRLTRRYGDLTLAQFRLLELLAQRDPEAMEPREMAQMLDVGSNHITKLLDQLEGRGLVHRREHAVDRRRRLVHITAAGDEVQRTVSPRVAAFEDRLMGAAFTEQERAHLAALSRRLRAALVGTMIITRTTRSGP